MSATTIIKKHKLTVEEMNELKKINIFEELIVFMARNKLPIGVSKGNLSIEQTTRNLIRKKFIELFKKFLAKTFEEKNIPIETHLVNKELVLEIESEFLSSKNDIVEKFENHYEQKISGFVNVLVDFTFKPLNWDAVEEALLDDDWQG